MIIYRYIKEFWSRTEARSKMIAEMPDHIIPMNYHLYEMRIDDNSLEMGIDYTWNIFGVSYSGNKTTIAETLCLVKSSD